MSELLEAALHYAEQGLLMFPLRGKKPFTEHGCKDAATDPKIIRAWWSKWPDANIGLPTGTRTGIVVVDVDGETGERSIAALLRAHGPLPETRESQTGRGRHLFFRANDPEIRNDVGKKLGRGLDVRAEGGYVVLPPSVHESGKHYTWTRDIPAAPLPDWLFEKFKSRPSSRAENVELGSAIPQGERDTTLARIAGSMRHWGASQEAIEAGLLKENSARCDPPLPGSQVLKIARSISRYPASCGAGDSERREPTMVTVMRRASEIEPVAVRWLWPARIPLGKLTLFAGDPDEGKTVTSLDVAARVTTGGEWPDGGRAEIGSVIIMSAEDDPGDTLVPRLMAAGADLGRVHFLEAALVVTADGKETKHTISLADVAAIENALSQAGDAKLVIVDPISAYLSDSDSHKNAEVRALLSPLAELAARRGVAILAITHLSKGGGKALYRAIGSIGFVGAARAAWLFAKDAENPARRLMLRLKNNLAPDRGGLAYTLAGEVISLKNGEQAQTVKVNWEPGAVNMKADDVLEVESARERGERQEVAEWLTEALAKGPRGAVEVTREARAVGFSEMTLRRARRRLGVKTSKDGFEGGWIWSLPPEDVHEDAHPSQSEHLQGSDCKDGKLNQQDARRCSPQGGMNPFGKDGPLRDTGETEVEL